MEDVDLQAANAVASTGANSVGPMTRSAEQAVDEVQVRLGEASARMGDEQHACGICIDRPRAVRSLPCGHGGLCELCTINLVLQAEPSGPNCVYCRCTVSRLVVVPVTMATAGAGQVLPRRMPTNQAVPEPEANVLQRDRRSDSQRGGSLNDCALHHNRRRARRSGSSMDGNAAQLHQDHMDAMQ